MLQIEYEWTVTGAKILKRSSPDTVEIEVPRSGTVFIEVKVKGFAEKCPSAASEVFAIDPAPEAVKIAHFDRRLTESDNERLQTIDNELRSRPNDRLFIFLDYARDTPADAMLQQERNLSLALTAASIDGGLITLNRLMDGPDIVQFWRVPPGAENPTRKECDQPVCPAISVVGPAGLTEPGDEMTFSANPLLDGWEKLNYKWSVSAGKILKGQGKPWITVQTTREISGETITAAVAIAGLPANCVSTAKVDANFISMGHPHPIDEFGKLPAGEEKEHLDIFIASLSQTPHLKGYIVTRFPKGTSTNTILKRIDRIKKHVFLVRKISKERIIILVGTGKFDSTVLWKLTPEYAEGLCPECTKY